MELLTTRQAEYKAGVKTLTQEKLAYEQGVYYTLEVSKSEQNFAKHGYRAKGYAMLNGCQISDWDYWTHDLEECYSEQTKDYLLRELRPMVAAQMAWFRQSVAIYFESEN